MAAAQRAAVTRHGMADTPTHRIWVDMRRRCHQSQRPDFKNYGGRGIFVCERWRNSFDAFLADMGVRPEGYTLERRDNDGPYSPENCTWIPRAEQEKNKRSNVRYEIRGEALSPAEAARKYGIKEATLRNRICTLGWSPERAATTPIRGTTPHSS